MNPSPIIHIPRSDWSHSMSLQLVSQSKQLVSGVLSSAPSWGRVPGKWWSLAILFHALGLGGLLIGTVPLVMIGNSASLHADESTVVEDKEAVAAPPSEKVPPGFGGRGRSGPREEVDSSDSTVGIKSTERAVGGGLNWLARHQNADGSWSFDGHSKQCKDDRCTCEGENHSTSAATAIALGLSTIVDTWNTRQAQDVWPKSQMRQRNGVDRWDGRGDNPYGIKRMRQRFIR